MQQKPRSLARPSSGDHMPPLFSAPAVAPEKQDSKRAWDGHLQKFLLKPSIYKGVCLVSLSEQQTSPDKDRCALARSHQSLRSKPSPPVCSQCQLSLMFLKQTFAGPTTCSGAVPPPHQVTSGVPAWPLKREHAVAVG